MFTNSVKHLLLGQQFPIELKVLILINSNRDNYNPAACYNEENQLLVNSYTNQLTTLDIQ